MKNSVLIILCLSLFGSCKTITKSSKEATPVVTLERADFTVSDQLSGSASETKIIGLDWSRLFRKQSSNLVSAPMLGGSPPQGRVESYAVHELLSGNPGHDVIFYPTFSKQRIRVLFFYEKTDVTVKARLGSLIK